MEIPSRYSILYTQLNKKNESFNYQNKAFNGIKKIKSRIKDDRLLNEKGAQLFYLMGRSSSHPKYLQIKFYLNALPLHQIYLVQAMTLSHSTWSQMAQEELYSLYSNLWKAYEKLSKNQKLLHQNKIMGFFERFTKILKRKHQLQTQKNTIQKL